MIAFKFLAPERTAPFTGFRWPPPGAWVDARAELPDRWIHACRVGDLPHWLEEELWRIQLDAPVRDARYQISAPRARLVAPVAAWDHALASEYARACALRARDLALPYVDAATRDALASATGLEAIAAAVEPVVRASPAAALVGDAVRNARDAGPAAASYVAAVLASTLGGGLAAFEAERAWQASWIARRLGLSA